jgi:hypothetical protein
MAYRRFLQNDYNNKQTEIYVNEETGQLFEVYNHDNDDLPLRKSTQQQNETKLKKQKELYYEKGSNDKEQLYVVDNGLKMSRHDLYETIDGRHKYSYKKQPKITVIKAGKEKREPIYTDGLGNNYSFTKTPATRVKYVNDKDYYGLYENDLGETFSRKKPTQTIHVNDDYNTDNIKKQIDNEKVFNFERLYNRRHVSDTQYFVVDSNTNTKYQQKSTNYQQPSQRQNEYYYQQEPSQKQKEYYYYEPTKERYKPVFRENKQTSPPQPPVEFEENYYFSDNKLNKNFIKK